METKLKAVPQNSPQSFELIEQLEAGKVQLKIRKQHLQDRLRGLELNLVKKSAADIRKALSAFCAEKIDLVLRSTR